jgi:hypothetical protein
MFPHGGFGSLDGYSHGVDAIYRINLRAILFQVTGKNIVFVLVVMDFFFILS